MVLAVPHMQGAILQWRANWMGAATFETVEELFQQIHDRWVARLNGETGPGRDTGLIGDDLWIHLVGPASECALLSNLLRDAGKSLRLVGGRYHHHSQDNETLKLPAPEVAEPSEHEGFATEDEHAEFHARRWLEDRPRGAEVHIMCAHRDYQAVIRIGEPAVPALIRMLQERPDNWFIALHAITGASPVIIEDRGSIPMMTRQWLDWAERNGYIEGMWSRAQREKRAQKPAAPSRKHRPERHRPEQDEPGTAARRTCATTAKPNRSR